VKVEKANFYTHSVSQNKLPSNISTNLQGKSEAPGNTVKAKKAKFSENSVSPKKFVTLNTL
jgi:hypothetical protein